MIDPDLVDVCLIVFLFLGALHFATTMVTRLRQDAAFKSLHKELIDQENQRHRELRQKMEYEFLRLEKMMANDYERMTHLFMNTTVDAVNIARTEKRISQEETMKPVPKRRGRPPKQLPL